ncbi:hypothetical protein MKW92_008628 [Papaver armeniacum]|nr:hypothetical protein MKW92_008628 [Papaver armeniacum]
MDLASTCKVKVCCSYYLAGQAIYFRIKELKDVLTKLGCCKAREKTGMILEKFDLIDRILNLIADEQEGITKITDDTYRKARICQFNMKVQCVCGSSLPNESMIQCEHPGCRGVATHWLCHHPEKPTEGVPTTPPQFYCQICRINRADPFWVTVAQPLPPVKLTEQKPSADCGENISANKVDRELVQKGEYDVQVGSGLLGVCFNDKVTFRMQWPHFRSPGMAVRTINRPGSQLLGANGRDDGPAGGMNKIFLSGCDARVFCLGVRIARRRTVQQVGIRRLAFDDALARVCRCIGGGNAENADSDSDLEVMSGSRMKVAGRFKPCAHMGCFDLHVFCPICLKNYSLEHVIIDPYFKPYATLNEHERKDLAQWHSPSGSLRGLVDEAGKSELEKLKDQARRWRGQFDFSTNNGNDLDAISLNFDPTCAVGNRMPFEPLGGVIVLSDSEDENENVFSTVIVMILRFPSGSCQSGTQAGPGFQLFGTETNVSDSFVDVQQTSVPNMNGFALGSDIAMGSDTQALDSNLNADTSVRADYRDQPETPNGALNDDWISLRLGGGGGETVAVEATTNGLSSRHQVASKEGGIENLANTASLKLSMNNDRTDKTGTKRQLSDSLFSHPLQPRSARPLDSFHGFPSE